MMKFIFTALGICCFAMAIAALILFLIELRDSKQGMSDKWRYKYWLFVTIVLAVAGSIMELVAKWL